MARKQFAGGAVDTSLSSGVNAVVTTIALTDATTYPDGSVGPFVVVIDPGTASEEKVLATSRSGNSLTGCFRGYDGTVASTHATGAVARHVLDALTLDEANAHVNDDARDDHSQYLTVTRHTADAHAAVFPLGMGAWTAYTPTLTASTTNPTLGTGSFVMGRYTRIGRTIIGIACVRFGTSGTSNGSGEYHVSLPVPGVIAANAPGEAIRVVGPAVLNNSGSTVDLGVAGIWAASAGGSGSYVSISLDSGNVPVSSSVPYSWGSEDSIWVQFMYEAAA